MSGLEVLTQLRHRHPRTPVVVMSGVLSGTELTRSRELGAAESLDKLGMIARIPALVERYRQVV
jgi:DNA-binding response OmpR family regulator